MKKAAIIPAKGLGDSLIMLLCAKNLIYLGYEVFFFQSIIKSFSPWLKNINFKDSIDDAYRNFSLKNFHISFLQNDNSEKSKKIIASREKEDLFVFYPTYNKKKHGPLKKGDFPFDNSVSMVDNIMNYFHIFYKLPKDKKIDLSIPRNLKYKKYKKRIAIHPTSNDSLKNFSKKKYFKIAKKLKFLGYEPVFILKEKNWENKKIPFPIKSFSNIASLASFMYESSFFIGNDSGPAHLASLLNIPSIVITDDHKRMKLWQPGWKKANISTPSPYIPNVKGLRLRKTHWQSFISSKKVINMFLKKF